MEEAPKYWILNNIHEEFSNIPKKIITLEKKNVKKMEEEPILLWEIGWKNYFSNFLTKYSLNSSKK